MAVGAVYKVSIATETVNMALDPEDSAANNNGTMLEAVTKDQLNTGLTGQIRYRVAERNLYAYLFGVKNPIAHVMGYFVSVLRERIANFEAPPRARRPTARPDTAAVIGISINDLRKNLRDLNEHMDRECTSSAARYGMVLDASLITGIDPPPEVESALAAINTAHNQVSSDISLAQASADQKIVQSKRAVEIETLKAQAEVEPLTRLADQLHELEEQRPRSAPRLRAQRAPRPVRARPAKSFVEVNMMNFLIAAAVTFFACFIVVPDLLRHRRGCSGFTPSSRSASAMSTCSSARCSPSSTSPACTSCRSSWAWHAFIVNWLGKCHMLDMRLDQEYLRSQPVNSEEGAPMGIGIWYEMFISDPVAYLFKNTDPRGSLAANVSNSTVRCLSNMPLATMLVNRHAMSQTVRDEVSPKSHEWGYKLGSIYIRKVHFRDAGMIRQIESKVVNRLRQVTSAIKQDGANQVSIITSTAERQAAIEFAKAAAIRPQIVGEALQQISEDPEVSEAMFEILETQKVIGSGARLTVLPRGGELLAQLIAGQPEGRRRCPTVPVGPG